MDLQTLANVVVLIVQAHQFIALLHQLLRRPLVLQIQLLQLFLQPRLIGVELLVHAGLPKLVIVIKLITAV